MEAAPTGVHVDDGRAMDPDETVKATIAPFRGSQIVGSTAQAESSRSRLFLFLQLARQFQNSFYNIFCGTRGEKFL